MDGANGGASTSGASTTQDVVAELDVYALGGVHGANAQSYLLQFPQRSADRPYEGVSHVRLKSKVKRMQWELPLDMRSESYRGDAGEAIRVRSVSLQSARVDPGMQGLVVAMRKGDNIYMLPVSEVLQLRHSPAYLDREKEKEVAGKRGGVVVKQDLEDIRGSELVPITVQVKKHETEQQTEARLRSYAFHAQQEEADPWIDLKFRDSDSQRAAALLDAIPAAASNARELAATFSRGNFLGSIVPGSTSAAAPTAAEAGDVAMEDAEDGAIGLGKPSANMAPEPGAPGSLTAEAKAALPSQLAALFQASSVLSLGNIRVLLSKLPSNGVLNRAAETASDAALHHAIMETNVYVCIRKSYTPRTIGQPFIDPLRTAVLELLREKETLKRGDVVQMAQEKGIPMTDQTYQKVMKELCTSRGSQWTLKTGA